MQNRTNKHSYCYFIILTCIILYCVACNTSTTKKLELLTTNLEGSWGVENSSLTEIWTRKNNDSLCAISYVFKDDGDSLFLSSSVIYTKEDKVFLDILNKNNKLKLYYLKEINNDYFVFNAINNEFYPTTINYKIRKQNEKILESSVDGKVDGKSQTYQFIMYKIQ